MLQTQLDAFTTAYVEALLWSETNDQSESGDDNFQDYTWEDLSPDTQAEILEDCQSFQEEAADWLEADGQGDGDDGHNFCLTRNGHGAGFWDGDYPLHGDELTAACRPYGAMYLYLGDDGILYHHS
jgi:hypothetical protein